MMPPRTEVVLIKCCFAEIEVGFDSFILNIYIAPLQENYSEALQTPAWLKRADDCPSVLHQGYCSPKRWQLKVLLRPPTLFCSGVLGTWSAVCWNILLAARH